ncbi:DsbA family protein [Aeromicrobium sp.]|uniref:DsbA family protein n=1 Tax=Aeromicrobium sp. TaxID=1871063 RepID=UPI003C4AD196
MSNERQQRAARAEQMRKEREKSDRKQRNVITIAIVAVVIALVGIGGYAIKSESDKNATVDKVINPANTTKFGVSYDTQAVTGEPATNPVTVVTYEDFQCPACRSFEQQSGAFLADAVAKGDITLEYRPIAFLDAASNGNKYSSRAGSAAMCVLDSSGIKAYKKMHDVLYANQPAENSNGLPDSALIGFAEQAGVTGIDSCIKSERFVPWLGAATDASRDAKVSATPTVMVDGKVVEAPNPANLQTAIDAAKKA